MNMNNLIAWHGIYCIMGPVDNGNLSSIHSFRPMSFLALYSPHLEIRECTEATEVHSILCLVVCSKLRFWGLSNLLHLLFCWIKNVFSNGCCSSPSRLSKVIARIPLHDTEQPSSEKSNVRTPEFSLETNIIHMHHRGIIINLSVSPKT